MIKNSLLKGKVDSNDDENAEVVLIKKPTNGKKTFKTVIFVILNGDIL
jgi:hypothetical protein